MYDHIALKKKHPTQKFHKDLKSFQKPQKFKKTQNLGLMREMHEE